MSNSLFNIGLSGINAAQYGLTTTGQNISNATTPGYSRESVELKPAISQFSGNGYVGTGVDVDTVKRAYSASLNATLNSAQSNGAALEAYNSAAKSLNAVVGDPSAGVAAGLSRFFSSAQTLSANPSDNASRSAMMGAATQVTQQVHDTAVQMDATRTSVNGQIESAVKDINTAASAVASLNHQIAAASATGQAPNTLLDERDKEVAKLSSLININLTTQSDGSYSIFTGTGQSLVLGARTFAVTAVPSPTDASELTLGYNGANGDANGAQPGYLSEQTITGGKVGGLLSFRSQMLDPAQRHLGQIAASFAQAVNAQNEKGVDAMGRPGKALFTLGQPTLTPAVANKGNASITATFAPPGEGEGSLSGDTYLLAYDGAHYTLTNQQTGASKAIAKWPVTVDGVRYNLSGSMKAGDSFTTSPTRSVGAEWNLATNEGSAIAAGTPAVAASGAGNKGTGQVSIAGIDPAYHGAPLPGGSGVTLAFSAGSAGGVDGLDGKDGASGAALAKAAVGTLSGFPADKDVTITVGSGPDASTQTYKSPVKALPYVPGATVAFGGVSVVLAGQPKTGDTFSLARNTALSGDGSNLLSMANLQNAKLLGDNTLTQGYADYVDQVGSLASRTAVASTTQSTLINQLKMQQQGVSGVNLDEEAANLMQYQQMYQANSKVIQTASTLFDTILDLVK